MATIYRSIYPPPHIPTNQSISQYLNAYNPDDTADDKIILEDEYGGKILTYKGVRDMASEHAAVLKEKFGLEDGDVVAVCGVNSVDHVQLIHAVMWAGGTAALISTQCTTDDFVHCLGICRPKIVVVDSGLRGKVTAALQRLGRHGSSRIIIFDSEESGNFPQYPRDFSSPKTTPAFDLLTSDNREHTAVICFSSGTSGKPKGVELSHYNLIGMLAGLRTSDPDLYNDKGRGVWFAPFCHIYGFSTIVLLSPFLGCYNMIMKTYSLPRFLELCSLMKANTMRIVPTIAVAIAKLETLGEYDLKSMKYILCAGAALKEGVIGILNERLNGAPIFQAYGLTEANVCVLRPSEAGRVGSVGRLIANVEARVVDDDMNDVGPGQDGELLVRGPTVFRRYKDNPQATKDTFYDGWMKTGDILRLEKEGYLYLVERKKEMIKYNGMQIPPAELEGILLSHPFVNEGAVCAKWDDERGTELPIAYITLSSLGENVEKEKGRKEVLREIREFVDGKVVGFKKLRGGVEVLEGGIRKGASGKVLRRLLPARLEMEVKGKL